MINNNFLNIKIFKYFYIFYVVYFFLTSTIYAFREGFLPSYGGDVVGLYNLYKFSYEIKFNGFGIFDYFSKLLASKLSSPIASVLFLIYLPILINIISGFYVRKKLVTAYKLDDNLSWLLLSLIVFEPLTFSLQLSGHTLYIPLLPLAVSLFLQYSNTFSNIIGVFFIAIINPYLIPAFLIFSIFFDLKSKNKIRIYFYLLISILFLLKVFLEHLFDFRIINFFGIDIKNRMNPSGIFPLNFLLPDINSFSGIYTMDIKNKYYTYLNVPEANYSCLIFLGILALYFNRNKIEIIKILLCFFIFSIILCLPPETRWLPNFYFPTYLYNFVLPELRIISRNFSFLYIISIIGLFQLATNYFNPKDYIFFIFFILLFFPFNPPKIKMENLSYIQCQDEKYSRSFLLNNLDSSSWDSYYSSYFNKKAAAFPVLDHSHNIKYCLYE